MEWVSTMDCVIVSHVSVGAGTHGPDGSHPRNEFEPVTHEAGGSRLGFTLGACSPQVGQWAFRGLNWEPLNARTGSLPWAIWKPGMN